MSTGDEIAQGVDAFIQDANSTYESDVLLRGDNVRRAKNMPRLPSGIIQLDEACGGGFPFGKITLLAGDYSTGKTQIALRAANNAHLFDHKTRRRLGKDVQGFSSYPLYVDAENALDYDWAEACGLDLDRAVISATETTEQCIDLITKAIYSDLFSCIIIDSLAALTPSKEIETSSEDPLMGAQARLLNRAMRTWVSGLTALKQKGSVGPAIIMLNLLRQKLGVMFGDNRVLPGGKGQEGASSIIGYTLSPSYDTSNSKSESMSKVTLKGNFQKNKTYIPRQNYSFDLCLKDHDGLKKGDIDDVGYMVKRATTLGLIKKVKSKYVFGSTEFATQKELVETVKGNKATYLKLYRSIIKASTGALV